MSVRKSIKRQEIRKIIFPEKDDNNNNNNDRDAGQEANDRDAGQEITEQVMDGNDSNTDQLSNGSPEKHVTD